MVGITPTSAPVDPTDPTNPPMPIITDLADPVGAADRDFPDHRDRGRGEVKGVTLGTHVKRHNSLQKDAKAVLEITYLATAQMCNEVLVVQI